MWKWHISYLKKKKKKKKKKKQNKKKITIQIFDKATSVKTIYKLKSEMRSFKSNENIHKKEGGSYYVVSANKASSVTLQSPGNESQRKHTAILRVRHTKPCPCPTLGHYILDLNPSTVCPETASVVSPFQVAIVLGKKENFSRPFGQHGKGWDLVLPLPLPASDRYLFLSVVTRLLCVL